MRALRPAVLVAAYLSLAGLCRSEEPPAADAPPLIEYGGSRESTKWIELPKGSVAVDRGITWNGVTVYLSLTHDLVAVDATSGKPLWWRDVSFFWERVGFREVETAPGAKAWAVELRPGRDAGAGAAEVQLHDLRTGEPLPLPGQAATPRGTAFTPRVVRSGGETALDTRFRAILTTREGWEEARRRIFAGLPDEKAPSIDDFDPTREVVLIVHEGLTGNCSGVSCAEAYEDGERVLVRLAHAWYQTAGPDGGGQTERPYGVFVLPRRDGKAYVLERNEQGYIGGPPIWKEDARLAIPTAPARELDPIPGTK